MFGTSLRPFGGELGPVLWPHSFAISLNGFRDNRGVIPVKVQKGGECGAAV